MSVRAHFEKEAGLNLGGTAKSIGNFFKSVSGAGSRNAAAQAAKARQAVESTEKAFNTARTAATSKVLDATKAAPKNLSPRMREAWNIPRTVAKAPSHAEKVNLARKATEYAKARSAAKSSQQAAEAAREATTKARRQLGTGAGIAAGTAAAGTAGYIGLKHHLSKNKPPPQSTEAKFASADAADALLASGGGQPKQVGDPPQLPKNPLKVQQGHISLARARAGLKKPVTLKLAGIMDAQRKARQHSYYMQNRQRILNAKRQYRAKNKAQIARSKKMYRRKLKYGQKKRRRISTGGHSYIYGGYV